MEGGYGQPMTTTPLIQSIVGAKKTRTKKAARLCVALTRVSTDGQDSHEAQLQAIEKYASANGITIHSTFHEVASGGLCIDKRPVLVQALTVACQQKASIIVVRDDRLSRISETASSVRFILSRHGGKVISCDGNNGDDFASEAMRVLAQLVASSEKRMISVRTKSKLDSMNRAGLKVSSRPNYGYRFDGNNMVEDANEQAILKVMIHLDKSGMGATNIKKHLDKLGAKSRADKPFDIASVYRIIKNHNKRVL